MAGTAKWGQLSPIKDVTSQDVQLVDTGSCCNCTGNSGTTGVGTWYKIDYRFTREIRVELSLDLSLHSVKKRLDDHGPWPDFQLDFIRRTEAR